MNSWRKYIPEGTRDILLEECEDIVYMEDLLRKIYIKRGFVEIKSPTLEFYDVFVNESSILPQEKMYKLFDSLGRILVLRPDMTTPIARIASTKLMDNPPPGVMNKLLTKKWIGNLLTISNPFLALFLLVFIRRGI